MPAPPIPPPTPYSCPHCGAALQTRAEFCPRCGARIEVKAARGVGWFVGAFAAVIALFASGGIGAGAIFLALNSFPSAPTHDFDVTALVFGLLILSVDSVLVWLCGRMVVRRFRE